MAEEDEFGRRLKVAPAMQNDFPIMTVAHSAIQGE